MQKKRRRSTAILLGVGALLAGALLALVLGLAVTFLHRLLAPEGTLFYTADLPGRLLLLLWRGALPLLGLCLAIWPAPKRRKRAPLLGFLAMLLGASFYAMVFSTTAVTSLDIKQFSPLSPTGKTYRFTDVAQIKTGAFTGTVPFLYRKGDFRYGVTFDDGKKAELTFINGAASALSASAQLDWLDTQLMLAGVPKEVEETVPIKALEEPNGVFATYILSILNRTD